MKESRKNICAQSRTLTHSTPKAPTNESRQPKPKYKLGKSAANPLKVNIKHMQTVDNNLESLKNYIIGMQK